MIKVSTCADDLVEHGSYIGKRNIAGRTWLWIFVLIIGLKAGGKVFLLYLLTFLNHNINLVIVFESLNDSNVGYMS